MDVTTEISSVVTSQAIDAGPNPDSIDQTDPRNVHPRRRPQKFRSEEAEPNQIPPFFSSLLAPCRSRFPL